MKTCFRKMAIVISGKYGRHIMLVALFVAMLFVMTACGGRNSEHPVSPADLTNVAVGEIIQFGEHDWRVLSIDYDYALILHEAVIIDRPYHYYSEDVTWETSSLRHWLNYDFFYGFSTGDRARIRETTITNSDNPWYGTPGGEDTTDRIFLLSIDEILYFFGNSGEIDIRRRIFDIYVNFISDQYSNKRIAYNANSMVPQFWWLRTPGRTSALATGVDYNGSILMAGTNIIFAERVGVRPALWLNIKP